MQHQNINISEQMPFCYDCFLFHVRKLLLGRKTLHWSVVTDESVFILHNIEEMKAGGDQSSDVEVQLQNFRNKFLSRCLYVAEQVH